MKQIAVTIPDNKVGFFIDLMNSLTFVQEAEIFDFIDFSFQEKSAKNKRYTSVSAGLYDNWEVVQDEINQKLGL